MPYYRSREEEGDLPFTRALKWIAGASALFAVLLMADFFIPESCSQTKVLQKIFLKESNRFGGTNYNLKVVTEKLKFRAKPDLFASLSENDVVEVCYTPLFRFVKEVSGITKQEQVPYRFETIVPVYRGFGAFPISLLIAAFVCLFFKQDDTVAYASGILTIVLLITMLMIL